MHGEQNKDSYPKSKKSNTNVFTVKYVYGMLKGGKNHGGEKR